jgi:hypothetical protein
MKQIIIADKLGWRNVWQLSKGLMSVGLVGILLFSNISFLDQNGPIGTISAETAFPSINMVLYCPFDDNHYNSSGTVHDWSGYGNDGKIYKHANYTGNTPFGRAMDFDGIDDYIDINASDLLSIRTALTLEGWIYWRGGNGLQTIVSNRNHYGLYIQNGYLIFDSGFINYDCIISGTTLEANKWTQVAVSRTNPVFQYIMYINGQQTSFTSNFPAQPDYSTRNTTIGCSFIPSDGYAHFFNGIIDELKIHNDVIAPTDGMGRRIFDVAFEENNGNIAYDRSGMNLQGTINGASWDINGTYGSRCLDFDGTDDFLIVCATNILNIQSLTIEAWIYWQGCNSNQDNNTIVAQQQHFWFYIDNNGFLCFDSVSGGVNQLIRSVNSVSINAWTKVAVIRSEVRSNNPRSLVQIFINGKYEQYGNPSLSIDSLWDTYIGCWGTTQMGHYFNGKIDNVQIYNSMNNVGCEVLRYQFETGNDNEAKDESPYQNDGILMNGATKLGYYNCTYLRYGSCLKINNSEGENQYVYIPSSPSVPAQGLDYLNYYTIEARIKWEPNNNSIQTIMYHWGDFWLYLDGNNTEKALCLINGDDLPQAISSSTHGISAHIWTYIAVTIGYNTNLNWMTCKIYINGILDSIGIVNKSSLQNYNMPTYIGCKWPYDGQNPVYLFNGYMDDIVVSNYAKTFHEDTDGDGMTDQYEIVRSVDSKEYNYLEYNGRYAILCAPVRSNIENQFKYDITQMRYYLIANGWSDCDIIFLTCRDNIGRDNGTPPPLSSQIASLFNGYWIDGEAYNNNLGNAFEALKQGGSYTLEQSNGTNITSSFAQTSNRDIIFLELRDHGDILASTHTHYFCTYNSQDYDVPHNDTEHHLDIYWSTGNIDAQLDNISAKYEVLEIDMCSSGGWVDTNYNGSLCDDNRLVLMSQDDNTSSTFAYTFYSRIWGKIFGLYLDINGGFPLHTENTVPFEINYSVTGPSSQSANADGIKDIIETWNSTHNCYDRKPYRNEQCYWNSIISLKEAHYLAVCACNDRFKFNTPTNGTAQNPRIWISSDISDSGPSMYV